MMWMCSHAFHILQSKFQSCSKSMCDGLCRFINACRSSQCVAKLRFRMLPHRDGWSKTVTFSTTDIKHLHSSFQAVAQHGEVDGTRDTCENSGTDHPLYSISEDMMATAAPCFENFQSLCVVSAFKLHHGSRCMHLRACGCTGGCR